MKRITATPRSYGTAFAKDVVIGATVVQGPAAMVGRDLTVVFPGDTAVRYGTGITRYALRNAFLQSLDAPDNVLPAGGSIYTAADIFERAAEAVLNLAIESATAAGRQAVEEWQARLQRNLDSLSTREA